MKKLILASIFFIGAMQAVNAQQFKVITVVESIVPGGIGRSRIIDSKEEINYKSLTTEREDGSDGKAQRKIDRDDAKIESLEETKLLNFPLLSGKNVPDEPEKVLFYHCKDYQCGQPADDCEVFLANV